jgi:predicted phosphatase
MKLPSKVTPYKESTIAKFSVVLELLEKNDMTPQELYAKVRKSKIKDISEFVEVLDCLYAMNKIEIDEEVLHYVG